MSALSQATGHALKAAGCIAFNGGVRLFTRDIAKRSEYIPLTCPKTHEEFTEQGFVEARHGCRRRHNRGTPSRRSRSRPGI